MKLCPREKRFAPSGLEVKKLVISNKRQQCSGLLSLTTEDSLMEQSKRKHCKLFLPIFLFRSSPRLWAIIGEYMKGLLVDTF